MPSNYTRRKVLALGSAVTFSALSGCTRSQLLGSASSPLTIRVTNGTEREYRVEVEVLKEDVDQYTDANVVDEAYMVQQMDGFRTLTEIENRRYHVRTRLSGMGYFSEQYEYQYYPSCGDSKNLGPTLSLAIHPKSDQDHPFIGFS